MPSTPHPPSRRASSLPPSEVSGGTVHVGWQRIRAALRGAGIAPSLLGPAFRARLQSRARFRPTPRALVELLGAHFGGLAQPDPAEGRWVHADETTSARRIVAQLAAAAPELRPLTLSEENGRLMLRTIGTRVEVDPEDVEELTWTTAHATYSQRTVSADVLVETCNALLALRELPFRFLPLAAPEGEAAYLGVQPATAATLDAAGLWDGSLETLDRFAAWAELAQVA